MNEMQKHIIPEEATILDALDKINRLSGGAMTLVVAGPEGKITGTLTDGDIRRGLLRGTGLADPVKDLVHRRFMALHASASADERLQTMRRAREAGIRLLPEIDAGGRLAGLVDLSAVRSQLPLTAVLMAGGRGERLRPFTLNTPKPLLEIGGRAIIDYNIENLARNGVKDVYVTVKYLADMMRGYFSRPRHGIMARCIEEESPLGTLGAVSLVNLPPQGHTLVMNSDLLTTIDLEEMYLHHISEGAQATIAAIPYTMSVPYAILTTDGPRVTGIAEKPTATHFANAGIYIFSNSLLSRLPHGERTDAPDFLLDAIGRGDKVTYYPINGTWIDIGSPEEFRHASDLMQHHRSLTKLG